MRILITGCLGLIGSELCAQLSQAGHELAGLDDKSHNCIEWDGFPGWWMTDGFQTNYPPTDLIIHCASPVGHARLTPEAQVAWQIVKDTQTVLEMACVLHAKLITFSSSEVLTYRGETDTRAQYALGKLTSEAMVLGSTVDAKIVRPYNVTGRRQRADGGFVMARFREQMRKGESLTVFGNGKQERCFTHVSDFARFVLLLIDKWPPRKLWSPYHPKNHCTILELVKLFGGSKCHAWGDRALGNPHWRDTPERSRRISDYTQCSQLGWEPSVTLRQIVREHLTGELGPTC